MRCALFRRCVVGLFFVGWGLAGVVRGEEPSEQKVPPPAGKPTAGQEAAMPQDTPSPTPGELPKPEPIPTDKETQPPTVPKPPASEAAPLSPALPSNVASLLKNSHEAEAAILKALGEKTEAEFHQTPLADVITYWKERHKIPIHLDIHALESAGVGSDTPITLRVQNISFRAALEQMLESLQLAWTIQHESLWITTPEEAERRLITRIYRVDDLISEETGESLEEIVDTITGTLFPASWCEAGGMGSIRGIKANNKMFLVVAHTWPVHLEIAQLLHQIRETAQEETRGEKASTESRKREVKIIPSP